MEVVGEGVGVLRGEAETNRARQLVGELQELDRDFFVDLDGAGAEH